MQSWLSKRSLLVVIIPGAVASAAVALIYPFKAAGLQRYIRAQYEAAVAAATEHNESGPLLHESSTSEVPEFDDPPANTAGDAWLQKATKAIQVERSKDNCPPSVTVINWNGRIGNHLQQISNALVFARLCHLDFVQFPPHQNNTRAYSHQIGLLDFPETLAIPERDLVNEGKIPKSCPRHFSHLWYGNYCTNIPMWFYRDTMIKYLKPHLGSLIQSCLERPREDWEDENLLTVHMRGDDTTKYPEYSWAQPPCSMYEKIISEQKFDSILLVKKGPATCAPQLLVFAAANNISVRTTATHQNLDPSLKEEIWMRDARFLAEDFCALTRARHLVLSFSTYALSAALLSPTLETLYMRVEAPWDTLLKSPVNCQVWPGLSLYEYNIDVPSAKTRPRNGSLEWLVKYPREAVKGPTVCKHAEVGSM